MLKSDSVYWTHGLFAIVEIKVVLGPNIKAPNLSEDEEPVLSIKILLPGKLSLSKLDSVKSILFFTPISTPPAELSWLSQ